MSHTLRILTLATDASVAGRLDELLRRRAIEVNRVPSGAGGLILTGNLQYDLIVVQHPLPDLSLDDFVASLRTIESSSTNTPVLVLTTADEHAPGLGTAELVEVLDVEASQPSLLAALSRLLGVAARRNARTMVEVEVALEESITTQLYQTENLSETGALLRGARKIPVGSAVRFALTLPDELEPISGTALVVRHTVPEESTLGIALQFAELTRDNQLRLHRYLESFTLPPAAPPEADSAAASEGQ